MPADPRARRGGLPDQRDRVRADRAAAPAARHRRRPDRLRARAGVPPARQRGRRSSIARERLLPEDDPRRRRDRPGAGSRREGVELVLGATIRRVERRRRRQRSSSTAARREQRAASATQILVAAGRTPNLDGLGLDAAGVEATQAAASWSTTACARRNRRVFAAGDVASRFQFTHAADAMARIVDPERAVLRPQARFGAGHPVVHVHRSRDRARRPLPPHEAGDARRRHDAHRAARGRSIARSSTARPRASRGSTSTARAGSSARRWSRATPASRSASSCWR